MVMALCTMRLRRTGQYLARAHTLRATAASACQSARTRSFIRRLPRSDGGQGHHAKQRERRQDTGTETPIRGHASGRQRLADEMRRCGLAAAHEPLAQLFCCSLEPRGQRLLWRGGPWCPMTVRLVSDLHEHIKTAASAERAAAGQSCGEPEDGPRKGCSQSSCTSGRRGLHKCDGSTYLQPIDERHGWSRQ